MRTIRFRGKRKDNGEWAYGYYVAVEKNGAAEHRIVTQEAGHAVDPETVGQFVGAFGLRTNVFWEGDIVEGYQADEYGYNRKTYRLPVVYHPEEGSFGFPVTVSGDTKAPYENYMNFLWQLEEIKVIGNIHQHPHLLTGEKEKGDA